MEDKGQSRHQRRDHAGTTKMTTTNSSRKQSKRSSTPLSQTTAHCASTAVFNIFELVESIADHLPARDILLLRRISKTFRNVLVQQKFLAKLHFQSLPQASYETHYLPLMPSEFQVCRIQSISEALNRPGAILFDARVETKSLRKKQLPTEVSAEARASWRDVRVIEPCTSSLKMERNGKMILMPSQMFISCEEGITLGRLVEEAYEYAKQESRNLNSLPFSINFTAFLYPDGLGRTGGAVQAEEGGLGGGKGWKRATKKSVSHKQLEITPDQKATLGSTDIGDSKAVLA